MRRILIASAVLILSVACLASWGLWNARADPIVRRATIALPDWPAGAAPVRVVLVSDIHIGTVAMGAGRLARIVASIDALDPDLVLIAGDFIYGHDPRGAAMLGEAMVGPLKLLRAPLGVVAVLGNHDHWTGAATVRAQLDRAGVHVIENQAIVRGPLAIGGVGDAFTGHADVGKTLTAIKAVPGARVLLTHSPDLASRLSDGFPLLLAGHTHCGQARIFGWSPGKQPYLPRYRCGLIRERGGAIVVTAGLGTSAVPLRYGALPDLWLLTLGGGRP